jgi:hypothetical protein
VRWIDGRPARVGNVHDADLEALDDTNLRVLDDVEHRGERHACGRVVKADTRRARY